jgi:hypothetical protein
MSTGAIYPTAAGLSGKFCRRSAGGGEDFPFPPPLREEFIKGLYSRGFEALLPEWVKAGADIIHASLGTHEPGRDHQRSRIPPGFNVGRAKRIKEIVSVPVIGVGRFTDLRLADEVIGRGEADLIAFGRQFLADPDFIFKSREGRFEDVRKCIACNQGCIERLILGEGNIRCAINPETGQETIYPQGPAAVRRRVWVIGGGPAGLTAACEAARLGHRVDLFEKETEWGGQLRYAAKPPFRAFTRSGGHGGGQARRWGQPSPGGGSYGKDDQEGSEAVILAARKRSSRIFRGSIFPM